MYYEVDAMSQKPNYAMSHTENMSEESIYILSELKDAFKVLDKVTQRPSEELVESINICAIKIDRLTEALLTLSVKLDAEAGLADDYEASTKEKLGM